MEPNNEPPRDRAEQHVPHGPLADLFARAERIRQAYEDLRAARRPKGDGGEQR